MFNVFDLGHALPLRVRRFWCCARLNAIQRVPRTACCISSFIRSRVNCDSGTTTTQFALWDALLLEVLRHLLSACCQPCFVIYEGHHHPA